MPHIKQAGSLFGAILASFIFWASADAAMVDTAEILSASDKAELVDALERQDVRQELLALGVDPEDALARIDQMTNEEIAELKGNIGELPAGADIGVVELLLIIIIIILLV